MLWFKLVANRHLRRAWVFIFVLLHNWRILIIFLGLIEATTPEDKLDLERQITAVHKPILVDVNGYKLQYKGIPSNNAALNRTSIQS